MKTYKRICIKDYSIKDREGNELVLERGREYITSDTVGDTCVVFTHFWVTVPVDLFAGEQIFTEGNPGE